MYSKGQSVVTAYANDNKTYQSDNMKNYSQIESSFIQGVKTNLELHAKALVEEMFPGITLTAGSVSEDNETNRIGDWPFIYDFDLTKLEIMPTNREISVKFFKHSKNPFMQVVVKSFAGWQALQSITSESIGLTIDTVNTFIEKKKQDSDNTPTIYVLMAPAGWSSQIKNTALSGRHKKVILCQSRINGKVQHWVDVILPEIGWNAWQAFTPMTEELRMKEFNKVIFDRKEMQIVGKLLKLKAIANDLSLSVDITKNLTNIFCKQDKRFRVLPDEQTAEYVERIKMR